MNGRELIGQCCPACKGTLKKKYNRTVRPAKAFVGCGNWPRCDYEINMDETTEAREMRIEDQIADDCWVEDYKY